MPPSTSQQRTFSVDDGDFSALEVRSAGKNGFFYFYDTTSHRLITDFILETRPRVQTLCEVTLIQKEDKYTPRLRLWKREISKAGGKTTATSDSDQAKARQVKASVDTDSCHEQFWKLIGYLASVAEIDTPSDAFHMVDAAHADLIKLLKSQSKDSIVKAVQATVGGKLTEADLQLLANRKGQLDTFERLLTDRAFFERTKKQIGAPGDEAVWQRFFEKNPWIFGYGLNLLACEAVDDAKLEQITTGASIFTGAGKRSDAIMQTRGFIGSLLFAEIKTPETPLLAAKPYRPPDVYRVSDALSGGVSQVQKTAQKATRTLASYIDKRYKDDGTPLRVEMSTIRPRQVLLIGNQQQLAAEDGVNLERSLTFELFRRSINDVEIITYDELLARARFIVKET